jgi:hypothetical protein
MEKAGVDRQRAVWIGERRRLLAERWHRGQDHRIRRALRAGGDDAAPHGREDIGVALSDRNLTGTVRDGR